MSETPGLDDTEAASWRTRARARLARRCSDGLFRELKACRTPAGVLRDFGSGTTISFASNDYLGMAGDPTLAEALAVAARHFRTGSGAASLLGGRTSAHEGVEARISNWLGYERALYFPSGYQANIAAISALAGRGDTVIQDRLNHASLIDGAQLSGAKLRRYLHNNPKSARRLLEKRPSALLSTDALFSMDGDLAPVAELAALCQQFDVPFHVDEAHSVGVMGPGGRGVLAEAQTRADLITVTFGKALGVSGAALVGCDELIEQVVQFGRGFIYSTAPPPALAAATQVAIDKVIAADDRREELNRNIATFRDEAVRVGLDLLPSVSPIQSVVVRSAERAVAIAGRLESRGFYVPAIRPPTVPINSARLRLSIAATHKAEQLKSVCHELKDTMTC